MLGVELPVGHRQQPIENLAVLVFRGGLGGAIGGALGELAPKVLDWAEDPNTVHLLTETMLRDLDCCRRLCETLRRRSSRCQPVA